MNRDGVSAAAAGVVGVLAVAVAAGATESRRTGQSGSGTGEGTVTLTRESQLPQFGPALEVFPGQVLHLVWTLPILLITAALVVSSALYIYREGIRAYLSVLRELVIVFVVAHVAVGLFGGVYLLVTMNGGSGEEVVAGDEPQPYLDGLPSQPGEAGPFEPETIGHLPLEVLAVSMVLAVFVAFAVNRYRSGSAGRSSRRGRSLDSETDDADLLAGVSVSSDAGGDDDLEPTNRPATNGVYRAWLSMIDAIGDTPRPTDTPREVASAAVEDGVDEHAVGELTTLFEAVRYGGVSPTTDRERRASEAVGDIGHEEGDT